MVGVNGIDKLFPLGYNDSMKYELQMTHTFDQWLKKLDKNVRFKLLERLDRVAFGNLGDYKAITSDLFELRCFFGGGIRLYFTIRQMRIVLLLVGGNKSSQERDVEKAKMILKNIED